MYMLAALSMKNRALIALITVVVAIFGGISLTSLKQELAPSIEFPQLSIVTSYPGASPDIVNTDVSTPIETAIQGITGLETTSTTTPTVSPTAPVTFVTPPSSEPTVPRSPLPVSPSSAEALVELEKRLIASHITERAVAMRA